MILYIYLFIFTQNIYIHKYIYIIHIKNIYNSFNLVKFPMDSGMDPTKLSKLYIYLFYFIKEIIIKCSILCFKLKEI